MENLGQTAIFGPSGIKSSKTHMLICYLLTYIFSFTCGLRDQTFKKLRQVLFIVRVGLAKTLEIQ